MATSYFCHSLELRSCNIDYPASINITSVGEAAEEHGPRGRLGLYSIQPNMTVHLKPVYKRTGTEGDNYIFYASKFFLQAQTKMMKMTLSKLIISDLDSG